MALTRPRLVDAGQSKKTASAAPTRQYQAIKTSPAPKPTQALQSGASVVGGDVLVPRGTSPSLAIPHLQNYVRAVSPTLSATPAIAAPPAGTGVAGGGTGAVVPGPEATTTAEPGGASTGDTTLDGMSDDDIAARIAAIEAETNLTREQLLASQDEAGQAYRRLVMQEKINAQRNREGVANSFAERGIARSGLYARADAEQIANLQNAIAAYAENRNAQVGAAQDQLDALPALQQAAVNAAERENESAVTDYMLQLSKLAG